MKKYIYCDLRYQMALNGINSVSELQRKTKLPRRTLDKCINNDSVQIHHNTAIKLCEALHCELGDLFKIVSEEEYQEVIESKERNRNYMRNGVVYFVKNLATGLTKIGKTIRLEERVYQLKQIYGDNIQLVNSIESEDAVQLEREFHELLGNKRETGEWFLLNEEDLRKIKNV